MADDKKSPKNRELTPDKQTLTAKQAQRVSEISGVQVTELQGANIADLSERLKWRIDPNIFLFRRVCGRVVKTDPVTGIDQPVPFATVHVEDTDCNFLGFFPVESPFWWFYPLFCRREEIATTQTDACGNFCVWIPRFDIDWLLRFRRERWCFLDLFRKPTLSDILEKFHADVTYHERVIHGNPNPPDPSPEMMLNETTIRRVKDTLGSPVAERLASSRVTATLGERTTDLTQSLERLAYARPIAPPRPNTLREVHNEEGNKGVARMLGISGKRAEMLSSLNFQNAIGPFWRCKDVYHLEFVPFFDVPDITFRVTQDVDGDGDEETIYSEGFFDVRWNAGAIPDVTLHANSLAFSVPNCDAPPVNIGACATPGLVLVGHMPLINPPAGGGNFPYLNSVNGYAVRPNRPHASGRADEVVDPVGPPQIDASAPLGSLLEFWGCNHKTSTGAAVSFYKVLRETSIDDGSTWSSPVPISDGWLLFRSVGSPPILEWRSITADADGWYPVVNPGEGWLPGDSLLLQWHQGLTPNGFHRLSLELGDAAKTHLETSAAVPLRVDNSGVNASFYEMQWRKLPSGVWNDLSFNCPVIHREGADIELRLTIHATAEHLRSVSVGASGCGDGNAPELIAGFEAYQTPAVAPPPVVPTATYWHKSRSDNNFSNDANPVLYRVDASFAPGAYTFSLAAHSRAFSPADGHLFMPTNSDVDYNPVLYSTYPSIAIAIVE